MGEVETSYQEKGGDPVTYTGNLSGLGGPTKTNIEGEMSAEVDLPKGRVVGSIDASHTSNGKLEGKIDPDTGRTWGKGYVKAFGISKIKFEFAGQYSADFSAAKGEWNSVTRFVSGEGTWEISRE